MHQIYTYTNTRCRASRTRLLCQHATLPRNHPSGRLRSLAFPTSARHMGQHVERPSQGSMHAA